MKFHHSTTVNASLEKVARFHLDSSNMGKITPPPIWVSIKHAPNPIFEGAEMTFTLWFGPIPVEWQARFQDITPNGFIDRQITGPYKTWVHKHTYHELGDGTIEIIDEVQAEFQTSTWWKLIGMLLWSGMPVLFAYRGWKTKRELGIVEQPIIND